MAQAYDFALDKIGLDIHAFPIWNDYVTFLKAVDAVGSYAENQKISAVRKVGREIRIFNVFLPFYGDKWLLYPMEFCNTRTLFPLST